VSTHKVSPKISVIVPLFNRKKFLPQLLSTIEQQSFRDIELILVDDGSEDGTEQWINDNIGAFTVPVIYTRQSNAGPYAARNAGLLLAKGEYIAFQDSDDEWPEHHLDSLYKVMSNNSNIDWVFGSLVRIDHQTREIREHSNLVRNNSKHPFLELDSKPVKNFEEFSVFSDERISEFAIKYSVPGSTQCALIKKKVFEAETFDESYRTAYDRFFAIRLAMLGYTFAYTETTHQIYHIHDEHISLVAGSSPEKLKRSAQTMIRGYSSLRGLAKKSSEIKAIDERLAHIYAWELSMSYQQLREYKRAALAMIKAIKHCPRNYLFWRSLVASLLRVITHPIEK